MKIRIRKHLRNILWDSYEDIMNPVLKRVKSKQWICNECIFENSYTIGNIFKIQPQSILDIGCARSTVPIELATLCYKVTGVDLRTYPLSHPNFSFIKGNFVDMKFDYPFDFVTCISVFKHVGLGAYNEKPDENLINKFVEKIIASISVKGYFVITLPLYTYKPGFIRNITLSDIMQYFEELELMESVFFKKVNGYYIKADHQSSNELTVCLLFF